jgi:hypothetical protein
MFYFIIIFTFIVYCFGNDSDLLSQLKQKYRLLSLKYHPDKHNFDIDISTILFAELSNIYDLFVDVVKENVEDCNIWEKKYLLLEKKYTKFEKLSKQQTTNYNQLYDDYVDLDKEHIEKYDELYQKYIQLQKTEKNYYKLVNKYNNLVKDYNNLLED